LIGGDLVVSAGAKTIGLMKAGKTCGVVNSHEIVTGDFTRDTTFKLPVDQLRLSLEARLQDRLAMFDATELAKALLGDSIYSNMMVFGSAWQMGGVPISLASIRKAIEMNGASVDSNLKAFEFGRWAYLHPADAAAVVAPVMPAAEKTLAEKIAFRAQHLEAYQGVKLAVKYRALVARFEGGDVHEAVALGYHKLLSYKDEYEVARLLQQTQAKADIAFEGDLKLIYHLAPPVLSRTGADGRPVKREFGAWFGKAMPWLARMKGLRGTPFDPFGYSAERRMERALIAQYEADMAMLLRDGVAGKLAVDLAMLPLDIRGFGPVKDANARKAAKRREEILAGLRQMA